MYHATQRATQSLRNHGRGICPDPAWMLRTRKLLIKSVSDAVFNIQGERPTLLQAFFAFLRPFLPWRGFMFVRGPALAVLSVITLVMGSSIASVSAAEHALPGDFLYPVKLATEQTRLMMVKGQAERLKLKTEFVGRRLDEVKQLAVSPAPDKAQRLQTAADLLKRDLETVKTQLHEASTNGASTDIASSAKILDEKSAELAAALKGMKNDLPEAAKTSVAEAEVAAVSTGVRAVQILIESRDTPELEEVMTDEELLRIVQGRVQGMENGVADAAQKLGVVTSTPKNRLPQTTATSSQTSAGQIQAAQTTLEETRQLIEDKNINALKDKLGEAAKAVASVEKTANAVPGQATSGTIPEPLSLSASAPTTTREIR